MAVAAAAQRRAQIAAQIILREFERVDDVGADRRPLALEIGAGVVELAADADRPGVIFGEQRGAQREHLIAVRCLLAIGAVDRLDPGADAARQMPVVGRADRAVEQAVVGDLRLRRCGRTCRRDKHCGRQPCAVGNRHRRGTPCFRG